MKLYRDYVERVEAVLTKSVEFIEEVQGVPVLLSILVLIFKHRASGSTEQKSSASMMAVTPAMSSAH